MDDEKKNRIVVLCGSSLHHLFTCATLIKADLDVVGICVCDQKTMGLPAKYVWRSIKKKGLAKVMGQILGRIFYELLNKKKDKEIYRKLYDEENIRGVVMEWTDKFHYTDNYSNPETIDWLKSVDPDVMVVHTGYWIGKSVRKIAKKDIVIGGHPGLIPHYRGSHSAFWAINNGCPEDVGCSIFWLGGGLDTGDLIRQEKISINEGDSFVTLGWKGMIKEAEMQAEVLSEFELGIEIPRLKHNSIPENSYYDVPTLSEYLSYRKKQNLTR